ncbi:hypothetical protein ACWF9G_07395 [Nocardia sp. NPDC055029]|uniref:hypothetical protein n=1 Tax=Nocardia sp. NPDC060259 TaxID=3347088 RepID=UPI003668869F
MIKELLGYRISLRQLIFLGIAFGVPYFLIGLFWLGAHHEHLDDLQGFDKLFSAIGEIIAWPPLVISDIRLR